MARPLSGLQEYLHGVQVEDASAMAPIRREALLADMQLRRRGADRADRQLANLAAYQQAALAERRERSRALADLQRERLASRPQAMGPVVQSAEGVFERTPQGLRRLNDPETGRPLTSSVRGQLGKALPGSLTGKLLENQQNLRRAEQALGLLSGSNQVNEKGETVAVGDPEATGKKGFMTMLGAAGDYALNSFDPKGVDTRAAIGDLGSLVIHDRSGAAVTAAEYPRLRPFIPQATDAPDVAKKKLTRFVQVYQDIVDDQANFYRESGYNVPTGVLKPSGVTAPSASGGGYQDAEKERRYQEWKAKQGKP